MIAKPILERELLVHARRPAAHRWRVWVGAVAVLGIGALLWLDDVPDHVRGRQLYSVLSLFALGCAVIGGVCLTAGAITEERAQGTLGLLFLTDLRGSDILLGKLLASSLTGAYALLGLVPLLGVAMLFGGVAPGLVISHTLLLGVTLLLSLVAGLWASTRRADTGRAIALGLGFMAAVCLLPLPFTSLSRAGSSPVWADLSPLAVFLELRVRAFANLPIATSAWGLVAPLVLAALLFLLAGARLSPADDARLEVTPPPRPPKAPIVPARSSAPDRAMHRPGAWGPGTAPPEELLETDPILWLLWRRNRFPRADTKMVSILAILLVVGALAAMTQLGWFVICVAAFCLHFALTAHMASQACQRIGSMDEREALEFLLTTPAAARGTLASYHRAFCQLFQTQFKSLVAMHALLVVTGILGTTGAVDYWLIPAIALGVLFAGRSACSWMGLHLTLRHGSYHRALFGTLLAVVLPSWGVVACILLSGPFVARLRDHAATWEVWWPWLALGCVLPFALAWWHRRGAERWLREHGALRAGEAAA